MEDMYKRTREGAWSTSEKADSVYRGRLIGSGSVHRGGLSRTRDTNELSSCAAGTRRKSREGLGPRVAEGREGQRPVRHSSVS